MEIWSGSLFSFSFSVLPFNVVFIHVHIHVPNENPLISLIYHFTILILPFYHLISFEFVSKILFIFPIVTFESVVRSSGNSCFCSVKNINYMSRVTTRDLDTGDERIKLKRSKEFQRQSDHFLFLNKLLLLFKKKKNPMASITL